MSRRSKKVSFNRKTNKSSITRADRSRQLNTNACNQIQKSVISHLELIGNSIVNELHGSERVHLKQQLLTSSYTPNRTDKLPFSSWKNSLNQILTNFNTCNYNSQLEYRTICIGDHDLNTNVSDMRNLNETTAQMKDADILGEAPQQPTTVKRKTRQNASHTTDTNTKKNLNTITRTICTRSSKLNALNNNEDQLNHTNFYRARKRRSSSNIKPTEIDTVDSTTERSHIHLHTTMADDISGGKVSRKKIQLSTSSSTPIEYSNATNEF